MEQSVGVSQWGEDVDWGPAELSFPESQQGAEWGCCAVGAPAVLMPGEPAVWGDYGHPTALQKGKWGAIVILGSARTGANLTWIGQMALPVW